MDPRRAIEMALIKAELVGRKLRHKAWECVIGRNRL